MTSTPAETERVVAPVEPLDETTQERRRCPSWNHLQYALALGFAQSLWFGLVYGGACYLASTHTYRVRVHFDAELDIPFVPGMVVFYMSILLLFLTTPFILRTRQELRALAVTMAAATLIAGVCFVLLPSDVAFRAPSRSSMWGGLLRFADLINLHYNQLPSLHVALSIICLDVFSRRTGAIGKVLWWSWAAAICLSTVLIHEHHVLDVVTGIILALGATRTIYVRVVARLLRRSRVNSVRFYVH